MQSAVAQSKKLAGRAARECLGMGQTFVTPIRLARLPAAAKGLRLLLFKAVAPGALFLRPPEPRISLARASLFC